MEWQQHIKKWSDKIPYIKKYESELELFFSNIIKLAYYPEKAFFGSNDNTINIVIGHLYLGVYAHSGNDKGITMIVEKKFEAIDGIACKPIKSTLVSASHKLFWLGIKDLKNLKNILDNQLIWDSFKLASELVVDTPQGKMIRERDKKNKISLADLRTFNEIVEGNEYQQVMQDNVEIAKRALTKQDFKKALQTKDLLNEKDLKLLSTIYQSEAHQASASKLAQILEKKSHSVINSQFAQIAKKISKFLNVMPPIRENGTDQWWALLANGQSQGDFFIWTLKPEFVEAITELNLFSPYNINYADEIEVNPERLYPEGSIKKIEINVYERNGKARNRCIQHYGVTCTICDFNFEKFYGSIGKDFIHVHHLKPIAEIGASYEINPIKDLRPVCPNCHAMLHREKKVLSIEELKAKIIKP